MSELVYDTQKIRNASSELDNDAKNFMNAKEELDNLVNDMRSYFEDSVNTNYVNKYKKEAAPNAESVHNLLVNFSNAMKEVAEAVEEGIKKGNANLN